MTKDGKPRIVLDINLLISAIISPGNTSPAHLLTAWRENKFDLVLTDFLIAEIEEVFSREKIFKKYNISQSKRDSLLEEIRNSAEVAIAMPFEALPINSRDKKDDTLLMCAFGGDCDYLITGDEDLLVLQGKPELGSLRIMKASAFLEILT